MTASPRRSPDSYDAWIAEYAARVGSTLGRCREAVAEMQAAFPELTRQRGHVYCSWGKRGHFWLVTPSGTVVDPTASQFPAGEPLHYEEWKPGEEVRVGKCMECGEEIWAAVQSLDEPDSTKSTTFCDEACESAFAAAVFA